MPSLGLTLVILAITAVWFGGGRSALALGALAAYLLSIHAQSP